MGAAQDKEPSMEEDCFGLRIQKFQRGDFVTLSPSADVSKVQMEASAFPFFTTESCLTTIGTVDSVMATGAVKVIFLGNIKCTVDSEALVKIRKLWPRDLVKLASSPNKGLKKVPGRFSVVLGESLPMVITAIGEERFDNLSYAQLDLVARLVYGEFRARVAHYASEGSAPHLVTESVFKALEGSLQDLPAVAMFASSKSSLFGTGDVVQVSNEVTKFVRWIIEISAKSDLLATPPEGMGELLNKFIASFVTTDTAKLPSTPFAGLLKPGKVVDVNSDGGVIVEFSDGRAWCIQSRFLQRVGLSDASDQDTEMFSPNKVSAGVDGFIKHALRKDQLQAACKRAAYFTGNKELLSMMSIIKDSEDENGNKPLHYAVYGNQPQMINVLLSSGANIDAINKNHHTALQFAVKLGFVDCVRELLKHHTAPNPNIQDDSDNTALHVAIAKRNIAIMNELVTLTKVDFTITNKYGLNSLHVAALKGNALAVEMILSRKCELVNVKQQAEGYAALHFAALSGHYSVVKMLLKQEACIVDLEDIYEATPLLLAAREGHADIVELLLLAGAQINKADRQGNTALHMSMMNVNEPSANPIDFQSSRAMKAVHKKMESLDYDSSGIQSSLLLSCFLARRGADITLRNKKGKTPLETASSLKQSALGLLNVFHAERKEAGSAKCRVCLEDTANTALTPCGDCLYCEDCVLQIQQSEVRMKRCLSCGKIVPEMIATASQWGQPRRTCKSTMETGSTSLQRVDPRVSSPAEIKPTSAPTARASSGHAACTEGLKAVSETSNFIVRVAQAQNPKSGSKIFPMTRNPRGRCIILNNAHFDGSSQTRDGSEIDVAHMEAIFSQLHFKVTVGTNLSAIEMKELLRHVSKAESQKEAECLVVILMSHGKEGTIYGCDGGKVDLECDVYQPFNNENCPDLQGKPKLFFVQACRGSKWDNGTDDVRETSDNPPAAGKLPTATSGQPRLPVCSEMFIAHATIPGYVALRNKKIGSWFLSAVSKVFCEHACTMSLESLMKQVNAEVMSYDGHNAGDQTKQTPSTSTRGWTKKLYFNPGIIPKTDVD